MTRLRAGADNPAQSLAAFDKDRTDYRVVLNSCRAGQGRAVTRPDNLGTRRTYESGGR
jgi:hypothetical protein